LSSLSHGTAFSVDGLGHQLAVQQDMLYCAQRYSCAVEDLLFTQSARNAVNNSRVRERLSDEQLNTYKQLAYCKECIMVRDGLARLPDIFYGW